jgi:hypothetical protein
MAFFRIWSAVLVQVKGVGAVVPAVDEGADLGGEIADAAEGAGGGWLGGR